MQAIYCPACGAALEPDENLMSAKCKFCGNMIALSPKDLGVDMMTSEVLAEMFRGEAAGVFLKQKLEELNQDQYWKHHAQTVTFIAEDDSVVEISYIHYVNSLNTSIFMGRSNVFLLFSDPDDAKRYVDTASSLRYPPDDKYSMKQFFPEITHRFALRDRRVLVVIPRGRDEYPLVSFHKLPDVHAAWIVSRLENLCCLLQFNDFVLSDIDIRDIYINPETHQAYLYGSLWRARRTAEFRSEFREKENPYEDELLAVRRIAAETMGFSLIEDTRSVVPEDFHTFLREKPKKDAFSDFSQWDVSLMLAYGKRVFRKLEQNESTLN